MNGDGFFAGCNTGLITAFILGLAIINFSFVSHLTVKSEETFIIGNSSYKCEMVNTLEAKE